MRTKTAIPDRDALARVGRQVRARLADDPLVYPIPADGAELFAVGDFFSAEECARLIAMIDRVAQPSRVFDVDYAAAFRTSYSGDMIPGDPFIQMVQRRIDDLLGMAPENGETVQGQRYLPGQEFKPHCDYFHTDGSYWAQEKKRGGQRCWTAMAFLNAVEEGGQTDFPQLGLAIDPQPGALLIWNNAKNDGTPNDMTLHAGTPVVRGAKYIVTKWYRTRRFT